MHSPRESILLTDTNDNSKLGTCSTFVSLQWDIAPFKSIWIITSPRPGILAIPLSPISTVQSFSGVYVGKRERSNVIWAEQPEAMIQDEERAGVPVFISLVNYTSKSSLRNNSTARWYIYFGRDKSCTTWPFRSISILWGRWRPASMNVSHLGAVWPVCPQLLQSMSWFWLLGFVLERFP